MACIVMACVVMAYALMAYVVMAYIVAWIGLVLVVLLVIRPGLTTILLRNLYSYGLDS